MGKHVEVAMHHEVQKVVEVPQIQHIEGEVKHVQVTGAGHRRVEDAEVVHVHEEGMPHPTEIQSTVAPAAAPPPVMAAPPTVMAAPPVTGSVVHAAPTSTVVHAAPTSTVVQAAPPPTSSVVVHAAPTTVMAQPAYAAPPTTIQHVQPATTLMAPPTVMAAPPATYAAPPADVGSAVVQAVPAHTGGAVYSVPGHSHGLMVAPTEPMA